MTAFHRLTLLRNILLLLTVVSTLSWSFFTYSAEDKKSFSITSGRLDQTDIRPFLYEYEDRSGLQTASTLPSLKKFKSIEGYFNYGQTDSTFWYSMEIRNTLNNSQRLVLEFNKPFLYYSEVFIKRKASTNEEYQKLKKLSDFKTALGFSIQSQEKLSVLMKVKAVDQFILPVTLSHHKEYLNRKIVEWSISSLFYGLLFGILTYNLFLYFTTKEKDFVYFAEYVVASMAALSVYFEGGLLIIFEEEMEGLEIFSILFFTIISMHYALLFMKSFLNAEKHYPKINMIHRYLMVIGIGIIIAAYWLGNTFTIAALTASTFIGYGVIALVAGHTYQHEKETTRFYLFSLGIIITSVTIALLSDPVTNVINSEVLHNHGLQFGYIIYVILISYALATKIKIYQAKEMSALHTLQESRTEEIHTILKMKKAQTERDAKEQFVQDINAKLRDPMHLVLGFSEILTARSEGNDTMKLISTIQGSGKTLLSVLDDIVDSTLISEGRFQIERRNFSLIELLDECTNIIKPVLKENVDIRVDIDKEVPNSIYQDPNRIRQIILNFLSNATKFTFEGSIRISVTVEGSHKENEKFAIRFNVTDSGIGMTAQQQTNLFNEYNQADSSISRRFGGTGLGLSMSKKIAELLDGQVGVFSEINRGSTFWFTVTAQSHQDNTRADQSDRSAKTTSSDTLNLLTVASDALGRTMYREYFDGQNTSFATANNCQQAKEMLSQCSDVNCLLIDVVESNDTINSLIHFIQTSHLKKQVEHIVIIDIRLHEKQLSHGDTTFFDKPTSLTNITQIFGS